MKLFAKTATNTYKLELQVESGTQTINLNGVSKAVDFLPVGDDGCYSLLVDNCSYQLFVRPDSEFYEVTVNGQTFRIEIEDERKRHLRKLIKADESIKGKIEVKAPMPGLIVEFEVAEGQEVKQGDGLVVIEAMKMENEIRATGDAVVKKILKKEKQSIEKDAVLMILES